MRDFAHVVRLPLPKKTIFDLKEILEHVSTLFETKSLDAAIRLQTDLPTQSFTLMADQQQLEQVKINILQNSLWSITTDGIIKKVLNPD